MDIRQGIVYYKYGICLFPERVCNALGGGYCPLGEECYKCLMEVLKANGVVKKVEGELPENHGVILWGSGYGQAQQEMLKARFTKVEEL